MLSRTRLFYLVVTLLGATLAARAADGSDWSEFGRTEDAAAFGWSAKNAGKISLSPEAKAGGVALRVDGSTERYCGVTLRRLLNLADAKPGDTLAFHLKQNFGRGIFVNFQAQGENIYRHVAIPSGEWARVELDMDPANWTWTGGAAKPWGKINAISIYAQNFDREEEFLLLDGFSLSVNGAPLNPETATIEPTGWTFPQESADAWFLGNERVGWAICKKTGRLIGGWDLAKQARYVTEAFSHYYLDDPKTMLEATEAEDVVDVPQYDAEAQTLRFDCRNAALPDLLIRKTWRVQGDEIVRVTEFVTPSETRRFMTLNTEVRLVPGYRNQGWYYGASGLGPCLHAGKISGRRRVTEYRKTTKCMILSRPDETRSFAHFRTRLDGNFAWPFCTTGISGYNEKMNSLLYTDEGWEMSLGTSPVKPGRHTSYEEVFRLFEGDWRDFLRVDFPSRPEVREELARIPASPEWAGSIACYTNFSSMNRLKTILDMTEEGCVMVLMSSMMGWADYYLDQGMPGHVGGRIEGEELRDLIRRIKALSPRVKVGIYTACYATTYESRILKQHPEWFRRKDKDGNPVFFFPGMCPNYASMFSNPDCYREIVGQNDLIFDYLDCDFLYLDLPDGANAVDWETGEFNRDDFCFRFTLDMKRSAARHGPDKLVFLNGKGANPYADVNFTEARSQLAAGFWRNFAGMAEAREIFLEKTRPAIRTIPLYWTNSVNRDYVNRALAFGWTPSITYGDPVAKRPFVRAAYEMGNASPVRANYSPDWRKDPETLLESFLFRRRDDRGYVFSLIHHAPEQAKGKPADKAAKVSVSLDLAGLDLDKNKRLVVWAHEIEDASSFEGKCRACDVRKTYAETGWVMERAVRRRLVYEGPWREKLEVELEMTPAILYQLYLTDMPAFVYSADSHPTDYLFNRNLGVKLETAVDEAAKTLKIEADSECGTAEALCAIPSGWQATAVTLDGAKIEPAWTGEGDLGLFPVMTLPRGKHTIEILCADAEAEPPAGIAVKAEVAEKEITVAIPEAREALLSVRKDGRIFFARNAIEKEGRLSVPLPPRREGGAYALHALAVRHADGSWRKVETNPVDINIPAASLPPYRAEIEGPKEISGSKEMTEINRTLRGVQALRSAVQTTATPVNGIQPQLAGLVARVEPETLTLEAGTTRKIDDSLGAAFASLECDGLRRLHVRLSNTYCEEPNLRGPKTPYSGYRRSPREFAGLMVDYHTDMGYIWRVALSTGVLNKDGSTTTTYPETPAARLPDRVLNLGDLLHESSAREFSLNLEAYAPPKWDGRVWLHLGSDWVASNRRLTLEILAANEAVAGEFLAASDPNDLAREYREPKKLTIPRAPMRPTIDGLLDDEMWQEAEKSGSVDRFFLVGGKGRPAMKTHVRMMYDDGVLYVGVRCGETGRETPVVTGGTIWSDDEVEIFLDPAGDGTNYRQLLVNSAGDVMERGPNGVIRIGAEVKAVVKRGEKWEVELAIPFAGLGTQPPKPGDAWRFNLCRHRPPDETGRAELITWSALETGFVEPANFGTLIFGR
jgi:hypothetical protein